LFEMRKDSAHGAQHQALAHLVRRALPLLVTAAALDGGFAFFVVVVQGFLPETLDSGPDAPAFALGIYGATRLAMQFPGGVLARRIGPARLIAAGLAVAALALMAMTAAVAAWQVYLLTAAYGAGTAVAWPAVYLLAGDETERERGTLLGLITFCALGGMGAGLVAGAMLVDLVQPRPLLILPAILLAAAAMQARTHRVRPPARASGSAIKPVVRVSSRAALLALVPALALQAVGLSMLLPLLREYARDQLGLEMYELIVYGLPAGAVAALLLLPAGRLTDRIGRSPVIAAGSAVAACGVLIVAGTESGLLFALGAVPLAAGYAASAPALGAAIADLSDDAGRNVGLALSVQGIALAAGPALTGLLIVDNGPALPMHVAAALWLAAGICAALALPRRTDIPVRFQPEEP
jgi:MFS family permease